MIESKQTGFPLQVNGFHGSFVSKIGEGSWAEHGTSS